MTPYELRHPAEQDELAGLEIEQLCEHGLLACFECQLGAQWDRALDNAEALEEAS
jgi:hypothetical protein